MNIRIISDLHLEFYPFTIPEMADDSETVLVLAGDVAPISRRTLLELFLRNASKQFKAVCFVPGNHEYYGSAWPSALTKVKAWKLPENVHVMDRAAVEIDEVVFLGATLWTDMEKSCPFTMYDSSILMHDYRAIRANDVGSRNYGRLTPNMTVQDHKRSLSWLRHEMEAYSESGKKVVMITHHGTTPQSVHPRFRNNPLNGAFTSDLTDLLEMHQPALAIHGHTHDSFDYHVGDTRVIVNPRGYVRSPEEVENTDFDPFLTVTV